MVKHFLINDLPIDGKKVLVRVDYNVPLKGKTIVDNTKIKASLLTIKHLLKRNCTIILMSHLGRPKGKHVDSLTMDPIAKELQKLLPSVKIEKLDNCIGRNIKNQINQEHIKQLESRRRKKRIFLLENLRFYKEEKENDSAFSHSLADIGEIYVNDAFAACHRKHASIVGITQILPSTTGFLLETELLNLCKALESKRPTIWIIGGAKLGKINLLEMALKKADKVLIGGALAFAFVKAHNIPVGHSLVDHDSILKAKKLLKNKLRKKLILPVDFACTKRINSKAKSQIREWNTIPSDEIGLDLGPKTIDLFKYYLKNAKTVVWNGPLGYFESKQYQESTKEIVKAIITSEAFSVCGGGETVSAVKSLRAMKKFSHVSTGGGASLALLSGEKLPGMVALAKNYKKFRKEVLFLTKRKNILF